MRRCNLQARPRTVIMRTGCVLSSVVRGFTLVELLVVLGIMGSIAVWQFHRQLRDTLYARAAVAASLFADYNEAVASHIQHHGTTTPVAVHTGSAWLKDQHGCASGSGPHDWLPCDFPDGLPFGLALEARISNVAGVVTASIRAGPDAFAVGGKPRADLASYIVAQTLARSAQSPGTLHVFLDSASVLSATISNAASADRFLRVDGGNQMQADLRLGGNRLLDATGLEFGGGTLPSGNVRLGNSRTGTLEVVAPSGTNLSGGLSVQGTSRASDMVITTLNGGQELSSGVYFATIAAHNDRVGKPRCPPGKTPQIFVSPAFYSTDGIGKIMGAVQSAAVHAGPNAWRTTLRILTDSGWIQPHRDYAGNLVFTKCG